MRTNNVIILQEEVVAASEALREDGVLIVVVGVGDNIDPVILTAVAGNTSRAFPVTNADDLTGPFQQVIQSAACQGKVKA